MLGMEGSVGVDWDNNGIMYREIPGVMFRAIRGDNNRVMVSGAVVRVTTGNKDSGRGHRGKTRMPVRGHHGNGDRGNSRRIIGGKGNRGGKDGITISQYKMGNNCGSGIQLHWHLNFFQNQMRTLTRLSPHVSTTRLFLPKRVTRQEKVLLF